MSEPPDDAFARRDGRRTMASDLTVTPQQRMNSANGLGMFMEEKIAESLVGIEESAGSLRAGQFRADLDLFRRVKRLADRDFDKWVDINAHTRQAERAGGER